MLYESSSFSALLSCRNKKRFPCHMNGWSLKSGLTYILQLSSKTFLIGCIEKSTNSSKCILGPGKISRYHFHQTLVLRLSLQPPPISALYSDLAQGISIISSCAMFPPRTCTLILCIFRHLDMVFTVLYMEHNHGTRNTTFTL